MLAAIELIIRDTDMAYFQHALAIALIFSLCFQGGCKTAPETWYRESDVRSFLPAYADHRFLTQASNPHVVLPQRIAVALASRDCTAAVAIDARLEREGNLFSRIGGIDYTPDPADFKQYYISDSGQVVGGELPDWATPTYKAICKSAVLLGYDVPPSCTHRPDSKSGTIPLSAHEVTRIASEASPNFAVPSGNFSVTRKRHHRAGLGV